MSAYYSIPNPTDPFFKGCDSAHEALQGLVISVQSGFKKCPCGKDVFLERRNDGKIIRVHDKCRRSCPGVSSSTGKFCGCGKPVWGNYDKCRRSCPGVLSSTGKLCGCGKPVWGNYDKCRRSCPGY